MNTPTEAHYDLRRKVIFSDADEGAQLIADSEARETLELRAALALGPENCDEAYDELRLDCDELRADVVRLTARAERAEAAETVALAKWNGTLERAMKADAELTALTAERDQLRSELEKVAITTAQVQDRNVSHRLEREKAEAERTDAIYQRMCEVERELRADCENETKWAAHYLAQSIADKSRAERAEAELADWSVLKGWGGTPEIVHKFIKGQQHRIHCFQNLEAELDSERARLNWLETPSGMDWQWEPERLTVSRASIDAAMKEDAK
jgi:hypothetical protein